MGVEIRIRAARCGAKWLELYLRTNIDLLNSLRCNAPRANGAEKARVLLGWEPTVGFDPLVEIMMEADLAQA